MAAIASLEALLFSDAWSEASVRSALSSPVTAAFVAHVGGVCVGYLLSSLLSPEGELLRIGVHPSYRRCGIGAFLMEGFFAEAKKRNIPVFLTGAARGDAYESTQAFETFGIAPLYRMAPIAAYVKLWMLSEKEESVTAEMLQASLAGDVIP